MRATREKFVAETSVNISKKLVQHVVPLNWYRNELEHGVMGTSVWGKGEVTIWFHYSSS